VAEGLTGLMREVSAKGFYKGFEVVDGSVKYQYFNMPMIRSSISSQLRLF